MGGNLFLSNAVEANNAEISLYWHRTEKREWVELFLPDSLQWTRPIAVGVVSATTVIRAEVSIAQMKDKAESVVVRWFPRWDLIVVILVILLFAAIRNPTGILAGRRARLAVSAALLILRPLAQLQRNVVIGVDLQRRG